MAAWLHGAGLHGGSQTITTHMISILYDGVSAMLSDMGWRFLEYHRHDARLAMAFKIYHGIVAVPMPSYFEHPSRFTRHMHQLSFRQVYCFF